MYIIFEGIDGVGKGTQIELLKAELKNLPVVATKVPGGTELGSELRELLFHKIKTQNMADYVVDALFLADWLQTKDHVVEKALEDGKIVIQDRSIFSQPAYAIERAQCDVITRAFRKHAGPEPDLIFLLFGTPENLIQRAQSRPGKEGEKQDGKTWAKVDAMRRIQDAYISGLCRHDALRVVPVDFLPAEQVFHTYVWPAVSELLLEQSEQYAIEIQAA